MTPAPSSRNRRSATLANPPTGPPPPPPQQDYYNNTSGHAHTYSNTSHSSHSSFSSQSGQPTVTASGQLIYPGGPLPYDPSRASLSSPRPSPLSHPRSVREQETWSDGNWKSIFDAALVKAQQAVQLDELQETALAANLYAQAANDLGRVIPMCSSEKKKQSMLAIQAIYLDRVRQLEEAALNKVDGPPIPASLSHPGATNQDHEGDYDHHYSISHQYPYQQYQPQAYQPHALQQHQQYHLQQPQQADIQQRGYPVEKEKGFRLFGKKRSKTQSSASHAPNFGHINGGDFNSQHISFNEGSNGYASNNGHTTAVVDSYTVPFTPPLQVSSPPSVVVSPIFMSNPPIQQIEKKQSSEPNQSQQEQTTKSSKWRPFGKKKSKSFSNNETSKDYKMQPNVVQTEPVFSIPHQQQLSPQYFVDPADHTDAYSQRNYADWYVSNTPDEDYDDEYDEQGQYFDDNDEDIDPYYIADTKGRAQATENQNTEEAISSTEKVKKSINSHSSEAEAYTSKHHEDTNDNNEDNDDGENIYQNIPGSSFLKEGQQPQSFDEEGVTEEALGAHEGEHEHAMQGQEQEEGRQQEEGLEDIEQGQGYERQSADVNIVAPFRSAFTEHIGEIEARPVSSPQKTSHTLEKTKSKRTWYGLKKKDKEKDKEKNVDRDQDRLEHVAKLMDEAMFGNVSPREPSKGKLHPMSSVASLDKVIPLSDLREDSTPSSGQSALYALEKQGVSQSHIHELPEADTVDAITEHIEEADVSVEAKVVDRASEDGMGPAPQEPDGKLKETEDETNESISHDAQEAIATEAKSVETETFKRSKSRHFSIFKSKKNKDIESQQANGALTKTLTNEDSKSMYSQHTHQSAHSTERKASVTDRKAIEMAAALAVRPKDTKRDSDEYVPYEYQEEVEGPLMERVEVSEDREIIGFVLPVEEVMDYTLEENEEAALENWDSWVSQLESFERVLSNKGLKKEKVKKAKKDVKPLEEDVLAPLGSTKANRSSIFSLGRSDTVKARTSTVLDLDTTNLENRPLSTSTILLDDVSINRRASFQSSKSGGSEPSSQMAKKHWWNPKRKETSSLYRVSSTFSMADLEQDQRLSSLLSEEQVKSSDDLTLNTQILSMPIILSEPSTPAPQLSTEAPVIVEITAEQETQKPKQEAKGTQDEVEEMEMEQKDNDVPIAPMPKAKAKSNKPKLLPISTPLPQLLKLESAEELWLYVQQAKTYATSRMNKGDKRSAAIALKRAQALEARWQEVLLEMASSDEDTDEILEDDEESSEEEVVVATVRKVKTEAPGQVEPTTTPISTAPAKPVATNIQAPSKINNINDMEDDDDEEDYTMQRRKSVISRSSSVPDKYSKYKVNKLTSSVSSNANISTSLAIVAEEETNEKGELSVKPSSSTPSSAVDGRLGSDATLEQMLETTNTDYLKYYIQRMKTDTVAKARNGSKFAALEGMKAVKILQQRLDDLLMSKQKQDGKDEGEVEGEEKKKEEEEEGDEEKKEEKKLREADDPMDTKPKNVDETAKAVEMKEE
ncbi:hypothetical protein BX616_010946 [Lobosporangium transversale]|uniref:MIT domain-containing protein n=1 Tax=Lobosporangium transversale TaxID=64571 RepID=A0A1Y2GUU6_9FUNG|nr:hypothetical protein BCR41DRAFT_420725 [Lobosporangium transversale]KAF9910091.1 hypothetical protein BX616_010946 [Lobosporangium transversale]ORZ21788.1 hypothetical protein BCR41DRAFT_420725 [Lobosporangium transversale]|eukprot:XP_021883039.1 hypothetical protein BCR41DRAFT_420725 [Lobosporangium transversale]